MTRGTHSPRPAPRLIPVSPLRAQPLPPALLGTTNQRCPCGTPRRIAAGGQRSCSFPSCELEGKETWLPAALPAVARGCQQPLPLHRSRWGSVRVPRPNPKYQPVPRVRSSPSTWGHVDARCQRTRGVSPQPSLRRAELGGVQSRSRARAGTFQLLRLEPRVWG